MFRKKSLFSLNRKKVVFLFMALMIFLFLRLLIFMEHRLRPTFLAAAVFYADNAATEAINEAVYGEVAQSMLYDDLVRIQKDQAGKITMAQVNTPEVNRVISLTTLRVQESLRALQNEVIRIPLGQALGSYFLANLGPRIPVVIVPVGRVNTDIIDVFEEAGINQTRHKIYLDIIAEVQVVIPFVASSTEVVTKVPIAECLYQGEVPDTVINLQFPGQELHTPLP